GDGFVVARRLTQAGASVSCVLAGGEPRSDEAKEMLRLLRDEPVSILSLEESRPAINLLLVEAHIIVDALFGTGFHGALSDGCGFLAEMSGLSKARVYSLDMPSGMNADTAEVQGRCFAATCTIAFGCLKPAHVNPAAAPLLGDVAVCAIGIPDKAYDGVGSETHLIDHATVRQWLRRRPDDSHKGTFGKLLVTAGSMGMTGAAVLCARAASRSGAGLVYVASPRSAVPIIASHLIEQVLLPMPETEEGTLSADAIPALARALAGKTACVAGCGIKDNADTRMVIASIITNADCPILLDADGINAISGDINIVRQASHGMVLTPHYGEFARLTKKDTDFITQNRVALAQEFAQNAGITLVLKGAYTVVAHADGSVYLANSPNSGLAKGGSGDLLAGLIGGLLAQGYTQREAAVCGVYLHAHAARLSAARLSKATMQPSDVLDDLHLVFRELE
ncbi:MAG: NAD(P)H-hydrate dehydratase, partial [Acetanaerobacterium sp.]